MDAATALEAAAPHVAALNDPRTDENSGGADDAVQHILNLAIAYNESSESPFTKGEPATSTATQAADLASMQQADELAKSLRSLCHDGPTDAHARVQSCILISDQLCATKAGQHALKAAHVAEAAVGALELLDDGDVLELLMTSLARLVRVSVGCRDAACKAGAERMARKTLAAFATHEGVVTEAHGLLHAMAFEDAASPHANALPPAMDSKGRSPAEDGGNEDDEDDMDALIASFRRQQLDGGARSQDAAESSASARSTSTLGRLAGPQAPDDEVTSTQPPAGPAAGGDDDLMQLDGDSEAPFVPQPGAHPAPARADWGWCAFGGAGCEGQTCMKPMPGCGHEVLLCVPCEAALSTLTLLTPEVKAKDEGEGLDEKPEDPQRPVCQAWCPVCRAEGGASALTQQVQEVESDADRDAAAADLALVMALLEEQGDAEQANGIALGRGSGRAFDVNETGA